MSTPRIGPKCKLFAREIGDSVYSEIDLISDLSFPATWDEADSTARDTPVKSSEPTLLDLTITARLRKDYTNAGYQMLRTAFLTRTELDFLILDGPQDENNSTGYRFDGKLFSFGEDQALANVLFNDITIKPVITANPPDSVVVVSGAPVFTELTG